LLNLRKVNIPLPKKGKERGKGGGRLIRANSVRIPMSGTAKLGGPMTSVW